MAVSSRVAASPHTPRGGSRQRPPPGTAPARCSGPPHTPRGPRPPHPELSLPGQQWPPGHVEVTGPGLQPFRPHLAGGLGSRWVAQVRPEAAVLGELCAPGTLGAGVDGEEPSEDRRRRVGAEGGAREQRPRGGQTPHTRKRAGRRAAPAHGDPQAPSASARGEGRFKSERPFLPEFNGLDAHAYLPRAGGPVVSSGPGRGAGREGSSRTHGPGAADAWAGLDTGTTPHLAQGLRKGPRVPQPTGRPGPERPRTAVQSTSGARPSPAGSDGHGLESSMCPQHRGQENLLRAVVGPARPGPVTAATAPPPKPRLADSAGPGVSRPRGQWSGHVGAESWLDAWQGRVGHP
ncbi:hypothetical protein J0S82_013275 [Galemys pyrenaicus]|uniref:Uncharacterized protein n=1 Tax=Galemys pyrenaicus TaxID=202257 RepID=A0A8J5ZN19_GALPY|nr:hypothetical protein J0S82_013275 [Galemys pyrenaicus]